MPFSRVDLSAVSFSKHANLYNVDLEGANLSGVDLFYANLQNADLGQANLKGADFTGPLLVTHISEQLMPLMLNSIMPLLLKWIW
jgi:uncharacterized protein YjbI with pentapeptide repeats